MNKEEIKEKLRKLTELEGDAAILPQVLLELISGNEDTQKRLGEISTKIQESQDAINQDLDGKLTAATENIQNRLSDIDTKIQESQKAQADIKIETGNFNKTIKESLSSTTSSLSKKIIWCFVGITTLIIITAVLAAIKYIA